MIIEKSSQWAKYEVYQPKYQPAEISIDKGLTQSGVASAVSDPHGH